MGALAVSNLPSLPPGFVLDTGNAPSGPGAPPPPQGFVLDSPAPAATAAPAANLGDQVRAKMKADIAARNAPPPAANVDNNPYKSSLPGPLGQFQNTLAAAQSGAVQGMTLGFGDELNAAAMTPIDMVRNKSMDVAGQFGKALQATQDQFAGTQALNPQAAQMGDVTGSLALLGKAPSSAAAAAAAPAVISSRLGLKGAAQGAAFGAVNGLGRGTTPEDRLKQAGLGAVTGGAFGGAVGGALGSFGRPTVAGAIPSINDLELAKTAAYAKADAAGARYTPPAYEGMVQNILKDASTDNISAVRHPKAVSLIKQMSAAADGGYAPTLTQLDQWRQVARRDLVAPAAGNPDQAAEAHFGGQIIDNIDHFIDNAKPTDMATGSATQAASAIQDARAANSVFRKSQTVQDAIVTAQHRAASTGSGGNVNNAIRQNIRKILDSPKKVAPFSPGERQMMEQIINSSALQNTLRLIGKLSPVGNGLMAALGIGAVASNPLMAAFPMAGAVAKHFADNATQAAASRLQAAVARGGVAVPPLPLSAAQGRLVNAAPVISALQGQNALPAVPWWQQIVGQPTATPR